MLTFTDRARDVVRSFLDQSGGELEALRITPEAGSPVAPRFELTLVSRDERESGDVELEGPGFPVLVKMGDAGRLALGRFALEVDVDHVQPMAHAIPLVNVTRPDEVRPSLPHEAAMRNAPAQANGLFVVPRIVE